MMNIYRLNRLGDEELGKITGGSVTDFFRKIACGLGICDQSAKLLTGQKVTADGSVKYLKYRCLKCGRISCYREMPYDDRASAYTSQLVEISEQEYDCAQASDNVLVI
jgi:hypothetical protein